MLLFGREIEINSSGMTRENLDELLDKIHWCVSLGLMGDESKIRLQPYAMSIVMRECRYIG